MEILTDLVIPTSAKSGKKGLKSSAYLTSAQALVVGSLPLGSAVILPFIAGVSTSYQRMTTQHRIAMQCMGRIGDDRTELPEYKVAVLENRGIAVQRILPQPVNVTDQPEDETPAEQPTTVVVADDQAPL